MFEFFRKAFSKPGDEFRVRSVRKKNNEVLIFPEHRQKGVMSSWNTIVLINGRSYKTVTTTIVNDPDDACLTDQEAEELIKGYKAKLAKERGEDIADVEIKEIE